MKNIKVIIAIIFAFCCVSDKASGQCTPTTTDVCGSVLSITGLPPSVSACTGASYTGTPNIMVPAPLTLESYTWSPAVTSHTSGSVAGGVAVTTTINTPATATTYCLSAVALGPNVIANGDFELGNTCFGTGYTLFTTPLPVAHYMLNDEYVIWSTTGSLGGGTIRCAFPDHTTGTGNMMIVNGTTVTPIPDVWQQTVNVCPGKTYRFSMFCKNWTNVDNTAQNPVIEVLIDGVSMNITPLSIGCTDVSAWQQITFNWTAGSGSTANIRIRDITVQYTYNDFVIDDISLRRISTTQSCITINPLPAPVFTLTPSHNDVCSGTPFTVTSSFAGGGCPGCTMVWGGGATGMVGDPITITEFTTLGSSGYYTYTVTNGLGCSTTQSAIVNIHPLPDAGILRLPMPIGSTICSGYSSAISQLGGMPGGTWSISAPPGVASVSPTGVITFGTVLVPTTVTVFYTVTTTFCGSDVASINITVYPNPMFTITGTMVLCSGSFPSFCAVPTPPTTGADWTTYAWSTGATTGPCIGMPAVFTSTGMAISETLTITNSYGCSATSTLVANVYPKPKPRIVVNPSPSPYLCVGEKTLIYGLPGYTGTYTETWTSSDPTVATVTPPSGSVATITGISAGTATITYTVTDPVTLCSDFATFMVTIYATPAPITGSSIMCVGSSVVLSTTSTGGSWSSSSPIVADVVPDVSGDGIVTGHSVGTAVISYTFNHAHTKCAATKVVTVVPTPKPQIRVNPSPSPYLCVGETTLIYGLPGYTGTYTETWTSSDPTVATVTPPSGSVATITGISAGTATITYTVTDPVTLCSDFATFIVTVYGVPSALTGPTTVCQGSSITLASTTPGGVWSSNNPPIADVVADAAGDGLVTGYSGGTVVISYALNHGPTSCAATTVVTVIPMPTGVCPTWYNDPILGPVFVIGGTPAGATVTYDLFDSWGSPLGSGSSTVGGIVSTYPTSTITLCITSVTYMGCPYPIHCCVTFNGGSPRPAPVKDNAAVDKRSSLSIAPNPNTGTFTLSGMLANITGDEQVKIEVIDLLGKVVQTDVCTQEHGAINKFLSLSNEVSNGVYIIKVTCGSEAEVIRCVLSK